jgi:hypothetical protein
MPGSIGVVVHGATPHTEADGGDGVQRGSSVEEAAVGKGGDMAPGALEWRHQLPGRLESRVEEAWESRWGGEPSVTQLVSPRGSRSDYAIEGMARPWLAAADLAVEGSPGMGQACGEAMRLEGSCPHPWRNGSGGSRGQGLGRAGSKRMAGACFVCGQFGHRAAQCPKRAQPSAEAVAVVAPGVTGVGSVDPEEFRAF